MFFFVTVQSEASSGLKMLGLWLVIVGLWSLCIGVFGGVLGYRWYHERKCSKHNGNNKVTSQGMQNISFNSPK